MRMTASQPHDSSNGTLYAPHHVENTNPSLISLDEPITPISPISHDEENEKDYGASNNPFSAFYSHPPTRTSLEQRRSESKVNVSIVTPNPSKSTVNLSRPTSCRPKPPGTKLKNGDATGDGDLEAGRGRGGSAKAVMKRAYTMWPTPEKCSSNQRRKNLTGTVRGSRACAPYRRLSRKQRWFVQIVIALLVIGLGVGLGVGISRAVGAGVWKSDNSRFNLPPEGHH